MKGLDNIRFSAIFADTVQTHGYTWARAYYLKRGMTEWEFDFWYFGG